MKIQKISKEILIAIFIFAFIDVILVVLHLVNENIVNLDHEYNFATAFQSIKLLYISIAAITVFFYKKSKIFPLISGLFLYISVDEWFQIHEQISWSLESRLNSSGVNIGFADWLIPYIPLVIVGIMLLILGYKITLQDTFIKSSRVRHFFIAGIVCFALVPVFELIGTVDWFISQNYYRQLVAIEEGLELFGATFYLTFVLGYLEKLIKLKNTNL